MPKLSTKLPGLFHVEHWLRLSWLTSTRVAFTLRIATIFAAILALFMQDLALIFTDALQDGSTSYILAVPLVLVYLVYRKRHMLRAVMPSGVDEHRPGSTRHLPLLEGFLLSATAVLLYWYGSYTSSPVGYHMVTLPLFVSGLCLILFNPQTLRQLAFPIAFLFFLMPPPSEILYSLGSMLQTLSAAAANAIVNVFNVPTTLTSDGGNPLIVVTAAGGTSLQFSLDLARLGFYSLIGFSLFVTTVAYAIRDKPWKKAAVIAFGISFVYVLNIVRIATVLFVGYNYGEGLALQMFHPLGDWVLILLGLLILLGISRRVFKTRFFSKSAKNCPQCESNPSPNRDSCPRCGRIARPPTATLRKSDVAKLASIILVATLLVTMQAPVFALTQSPLIVTVNTSGGKKYSAQILPQIDDYNLTFRYEDSYVERTTKTDIALVYLYNRTDGSSESILVSLQIASSQSSLHGWETSLLTWPLSQGVQPSVSQIALEEVQLLQIPPITGRYFVFETIDTGRIQAVLYWYETVALMINETVQQKFVQISLIAVPSSIEKLISLRTRLVYIATEVANQWQPAHTWSQAAVFISQSGLTLSTSICAALAATIGYHFAQERKRRKARRMATEKLSDTNKHIVRAVGEAKKPVTLESIAAILQENNQQTITAEQLDHRLRELQEADIIGTGISSCDDEPLQTWKT